MGSMGRVSGADKQTSDSVDGGGGRNTFPALPCCFQGPSVLS